jgi:hypothetical protein
MIRKSWQAIIVHWWWMADVSAQEKGILTMKQEITDRQYSVIGSLREKDYSDC